MGAVATGYPRIVKDPARLVPRPNVLDWGRERRDFSWDGARRLLDGLPGGGLNIAHEAVDRHVAGGLGDKVALRWLGRGGERRELTFGELKAQSDRFAGLLAGLGMQPGEAVFLLCGRVPELYVAALGALKNRSVVSPLFAAFGPEPIATPSPRASRRSWARSGCATRRSPRVPSWGPGSVQPWPACGPSSRS